MPEHQSKPHALPLATLDPLAARTYGPTPLLSVPSAPSPNVPQVPVLLTAIHSLISDSKLHINNP